MHGVNARYIHPNPPTLEGPSLLASPLLLPSLHPMPLGLTWLKGGSGRQGTRPRRPAGFPGPGWEGKTSHISPDALILEGPSPSAFPLLSPFPPSHIPRIHEAGEQRTWSGNPAGFPGPEWVGETPAVLPLILWSWKVASIYFSSSSTSSLPPMPLGPTQLERAPEGEGPDPEAQ